MLYSPHVEQLFDKVFEKVPRGQAVQVGDAIADMYPFVHGMHSTLAFLGEYNPGLHESHLVSPSFSPKFPGEHDMHP
jgi:hypothetical protein